ncbi:hypothetical protein GCM10010306_090600 [Streptomyces umbrinus]|nr:hypothetical protein GCM10010306_090600 [Streptomyces umbrinus]
MRELHGPQLRHDPSVGGALHDGEARPRRRRARDVHEQSAAGGELLDERRWHALHRVRHEDPVELPTRHALLPRTTHHLRPEAEIGQPGSGRVGEVPVPI